MLNTAQIKCLSVFSIFAIIGFGPISPGCLIGMYIVVKRPDWFRLLIEAMYRDKARDTGFISAARTRETRIKAFASLFTLFLIDIAPVPVTPVIAFAVILSRPHWLYRVVRQVYGEVA
ncbi:hypothetical protein [Methylomonas sp. UP202]|uniref:hypothetical protein n=1 Tax=Methylomonas sp. UP202 TaxID=3040943 RepID=UPI00247B0D5B|nr:hypothetical protein [Methylomonas sp. UP202]WGS87657.1 hypothetical protein QC632_07820 [Methylomonas sp. UP202]